MALLVKADQMKITVQHDPLPAGFKVSWKLYIGALPPVLQTCFIIYVTHAFMQDFSDVIAPTYHLINVQVTFLKREDLSSICLLVP